MSTAATAARSMLDARRIVSSRKVSLRASLGASFFLADVTAGAFWARTVPEHGGYKSAESCEPCAPIPLSGPRDSEPESADLWRSGEEIIAVHE